MAVNTKHPLELELAKICETADIRVGFAGGVGRVEPPTSDLDPPLLLLKNKWGVGFRPPHIDLPGICLIYSSEKSDETGKKGLKTELCPGRQ